jgi:hypothetical protein
VGWLFGNDNLNTGETHSSILNPSRSTSSYRANGLVLSQHTPAIGKSRQTFSEIRKPSSLLAW